MDDRELFSLNYIIRLLRTPSKGEMQMGKLRQKFEFLASGGIFFLCVVFLFGGCTAKKIETMCSSKTPAKRNGANRTLTRNKKIDRVIMKRFSGDLLKKNCSVLPETTFVGSFAGNGQVLREIRYTLQGKAAHKVERVLVERYGMGRLKFACCGWEPSEGKIGVLRPPLRIEVDGITHEIHFSVTMFSTETTINRRAEWGRIPQFNVVVRVLDV